jgi:Delta14-sterol reductase
VPGTSPHGSGVLDLKYFCELRPGLFLWHLINVACAVVQWERTGALSPALVIVLVLQGLYVADSVYNEDCILTTIDIIQDGFGFMLAFGDLAWVPFMYSLQARFLVSGHAPALSGSLPFLAVCAAVGVGGFYVFRAANAQKDAWKRDPTAPQFKGAWWRR